MLPTLSKLRPLRRFSAHLKRKIVFLAPKWVLCFFPIFARESFGGFALGTFFRTNKNKKKLNNFAMDFFREKKFGKFRILEGLNHGMF